MKKSLSIFFAFVYLLVSTGILLNVHYCGGKVNSVGFSFLAKKLCACGISDDDGCCKDEQKLVKLNDVHKGLSPTNFLNLLKQVSVQTLITAFSITPSFVITSSISHISAPPYPPGPLYDLFCTYRI